MTLVWGVNVSFKRYDGCYALGKVPILMEFPTLCSDTYDGFLCWMLLGGKRRTYHRYVPNPNELRYAHTP